ncbi:MAG: 30S ribosomal protein S9 [Thermodesulfobacteriota bacterium]
MEKENLFYATGKRKCAIARTWLTPGNGMILVNGLAVDEYFPTDSAKAVLTKPLIMTNMRGSYDINIRVKGGGVSGQAEAIRHGITKALILADPQLRGALKKAGFIRRDPRIKERKKYGQRAARARFQFSKR